MVNYILLAGALFSSAFTLDFDVIDLTHTIGPDVVLVPRYPPFNFTILNRGFSEQFNIWIEDNYFCTPEHILTHIDAPAHMIRGRPHVHEIPLEKLIGPGVIIDVKDQVSVNPKYGVQVQDLKDWECRYGRIPDGAIVIMNSGWSQRYPNPNLVFNSQDINDPNTWRYPSWTFEAADWLLKNRRVNAVGVDTLTLDFLDGDTLPVHRRLFRDSVVGLEGVANLDAVPAHGSTIFIPVIKLYMGSGGPARMFATVPKMKIKYSY